MRQFEPGRQRPVETTRRLGVEVLDRRILPEVGILQTRDEPFVLALGNLAIDEQPEPLLEGEPLDAALASLLVERLGHAGEGEGVSAHVYTETCRVALEALVLSLQRPVFNLAVRMLANRPDAEDATQEILIKVVTHLADVRDEEAAGAWAFRIACRHLVHVRRQGRVEATVRAFATDLSVFAGIRRKGREALKTSRPRQCPCGCYRPGASRLAIAPSAARGYARSPMLRHAQPTWRRVLRGDKQGEKPATIRMRMLRRGRIEGRA